MRKKFSSSWKGSKQKRKQRKYLANASLHLRHKFLASNLSKELRKKHSRRNFPLRKGDKVKVMRGKFKGKEGKINNVNLKKIKVSIEGIQIQKKDGTKINVYFHPSKLQILELNLEDKERIKALERHNQGSATPINKKEKEIKSEKSKGEEKNASEKK